MVRWCWKDPVPPAVQTQDPKTKVSPRLKAAVDLMKIEAVEFAIRSSARALPGAPGVLYMVQDMQSFLFEYFSTEVLVLHANRCRAAQVE
jgi:hypothetical protein